MKLRNGLIYGSLFILVGCATPYQEMGLLGGVSATQIDATTMRVVARGNGLSDISRMKNYVLLKAAEETVRHGYDLFEVVNEENVTHDEHFSLPSFHTATAITPAGPVTMSYMTDTQQTVTKPGDDIVIRMFSGAKPANAPANVFDAHEVVRYLAPQLGVANVAPEPETAMASNDPSVPALPIPTAASACKDDPAMERWARANGYRYSGCATAPGQ